MQLKEAYYDEPMLFWYGKSLLFTSFKVVPLKIFAYYSLWPPNVRDLILHTTDCNVMSAPGLERHFLTDRVILCLSRYLIPQCIVNKIQLDQVGIGLVRMETEAILADSLAGRLP